MTAIPLDSPAPKSGRSKHQLYQQHMNSYMAAFTKVYGADRGFAIDGPINPELWFRGKCTPKILFVLKEAYGYDGDDVHEVMGKPERYNDSKTFRIISKLGHAIPEVVALIKERKLNVSSDNLFPVVDQVFDTLPHLGNGSKKAGFSNVSIVEIKKLSGTEKSNNSDIKEHGIQFKEYLKKQIELLEPDVIFCGGEVVWEVVTQNLGLFAPGIIPVSVQEVKVNGMMLFRSCHPSYSGFNFYDALFNMSTKS